MEPINPPPNERSATNIQESSIIYAMLPIFNAFVTLKLYAWLLIVVRAMMSESNADG
ncbi:hypothetical protein PAP_05400 [Palaeococcus pacificus DY20341]|uniref:Uncharacterized protein n=1 Tax=Palaeococcus pacificus DY20341 TaxID=1343739 RepID=A0A075LY21_9EURY|nr:hypothetical protein PAP_05400 [Palaeococcus pacificus DY20341]